MLYIMEGEHILGNSTPEAFARYVDVYEQTAIRAMTGVGMNILGAWRQTTGPMGRDLLLTASQSMSAAEAIGPKLMQHEAVREGGPLVMGLGFRIDEDSRIGVTFPFADERRLAQGAAAPGTTTRCYRLIRRQVGLAGVTAASNALSDLADALEAADSWKLFTAYRATTGHVGEISEIWITDDITREWYPPVAPVKALNALDKVTREASIHLLDPLPYSRAQ